MTREQWARVKAALGAALEQGARGRAAALAACADDPALRREVEELLGAEAAMGTFLDAPVAPILEAQAIEVRDDADLAGWTRYLLISEIGRGGMAVVYRAWDPRLQRTVAVKLISGHDELTIRRFVREAEAQARVDHDHIAKVYETGVVGRYHYIAMQFVDGPPLMDVREETTLDQRVDLMLKVTEGLHAAHRHGLVHRDIKPNNVLVDRTPDGLKPYLMDFGLAVDVDSPALTTPGVVLGTPRYMAPERISAGADGLDRRSDIYSLGATFYEFLSGTPLFAEQHGLQVLVKVMQSDLLPLGRLEPSVPPDLSAIVMKCLDDDPQRRYASARALADDLERYRAGDPVLARPAGAITRAAKAVRKYPRTAAAIAALACTTIAVAGWAAYASWRAARQAALAQQIGQEVRDLEWLLRAAQMSPLHPIAPEKSLVRERVARIQETTAALGGLGAGAGEYATGRGLLAVGEHSRALQHLERAWQAGYRTADSAMALGLAHGHIFRAERARADRIDSAAARAARIALLERAHRDSAVAFLSQGRGSAIVPARYVDALLAAHRGDLATAVFEANAAAADTPWLFEAHLLAGDLQFAEAVRLYLRGESPRALSWATAADASYAAAGRVAPSAIEAHSGRCAMAGLLLHMAQHEVADADPDALSRQAEESCGNAVTIEPRLGTPYQLHSDALRAWAGVQVIAGRSPGDAYDRAFALGQRALAFAAEPLEPLLSLADTRIDKAWWQSKAGIDPTDAVHDAVALYEKALAIDPRNLTGANNMGQAFLLLSRYRLDRGDDAAAAVARAAASFTRALEIDPTLAMAQRNLAKVAELQARVSGGPRQPPP